MDRERMFLGAAFSALILVALGLSGCKPELGAPPSLIETPQLLDLQAAPAEAKPGATVTLKALLAAPEGALETPVVWTVCRTPKPPAESNAVSRTCVDEISDSDPADGPAPVTVPADACSLFGPLTPPAQPGQPAIRPRDPDATGGFYQPIRAAIRGLASSGGDLLGFALVRISCALANAPGDVTKQFNDPVTGYHINVAPTFLALTATDASGMEWVVPDAGRGTPPAALPVVLRPGQLISVRAAWPAETAEVFPVFDIGTRALVYTREALRVSWFATAGSWSHDRTGRADNDSELSTDNTWTAPPVDSATTVHVWLVLRDNRGGSAWGQFRLMVSP